MEGRRPPGLRGPTEAYQDPRRPGPGPFMATWVDARAFRTRAHGLGRGGFEMHLTGHPLEG